MSYHDDDDKYDDDIHYEDDYDDDADDDDDTDGGGSGSLRSRINPYSSGSSGGGSGFGSRTPSSGGSPFSRGAPPSSSGGGTGGGSGSGSSSSGFGGINRPTSGSAFARTTPPSSSSSSSSSPRTFGGGSSGGSSGGLPGARTGGIGGGSGSSGSSGGGSAFNRGASSASPSSSGSSGGGGASSGSGASKPTDDKKANDDKKDEKPSLASRFGGLTGRLGGGDKADDKKDGDSKPSSGGLAGRLGFGGDKSGADKKDGDDKGASGIGARLGGLGGGLAGRFGGGGDKSASGDDKKGSDSKPAGGGFTSRFGGGGGDKPATPKKDGDDKGGGGISAQFDNLKGRFSGAFGKLRPGGGGADAEENKPASPAQKSTATGSGIGGGARFGASGNAAPKGAAAPAAKGAAAAPDAEKKSFFSAITDRFPKFGGGEDKKAAKTSKTRASKIPHTAEEGMSLDTKLDILGVGLVFGALMLFFSALSPQQGALTGEVNLFLSKLLGWGAMAVPLTMLGIGVWLILRHFGDEAPEVDPMRIGGLALIVICVLVCFQYIESFNPLYKSDLSIYRLMSQNAIDNGRGGGMVGWEVYNFLITNLTEIGGFVILLGAIVISIILITRTSAAELAMIVLSLWRSLQLSLQQRRQRREAARLEAQQALALAQAEAPQPQISVSRPPVAELGAGAAATLPLPLGEGDNVPAAADRPITIRMGGQTFNDATEAQPVPMTAQPPPVLVPATAGHAAPTSAPESPATGGGLAARFRGAVPWGGKANDQGDAEKSDSVETAEKSSGLRGMFARSSSISGIGELPHTSAPRPPVPAPPTLGNPPVGAALEAASDDVDSETLSPEFMKPATPKGLDLGSLKPVTGTLTAASAGSDATPTATEPAHVAPKPEAVEAPAQPAASVQYNDQPVDRNARLNQIRQGMGSRALGTSSTLGTPITPAPAPVAAVPSTPAPPTPSEPTPAAPAATSAATGGSMFGVRPAPTPSTPAASAQKPTADSPVIGPAVASAPQVTLPTTPPDDVPVVSNRPPAKVYTLPDYRTLLSAGSEQDFDREMLVKRARIIEETLQSFGAPGRVVEINTGPVITQFGVEPDYLTVRGGKKSRVKVSAIAQLDKDMQLALGAKSIRIEAPVPGKGYVGIEVPNDQPATVSLRDVMDSKAFNRIKSPLGIGLGQSVDGAPVAGDLTSMPHLLVAGTTGSGKSVMMNAIIASLLLRNPPDRVKFIMVDPKRVELTGYNGIPHLVAPVVVELERIVGVLKWVTREMDERYKKFSTAGARNIEDYNKHLGNTEPPLPYIVVIIDELADLMMLAPEETERTITRIAALARATGIHLVIATQRPSVDVVTGLIKANFPARIAFAVASGIDSRVILDQPGAERLLGRGDMLYMSGDSPAPLRLQGVYLSDAEINNIVRYWRAQGSGDAPPRGLGSDEDASESGAGRFASSRGGALGGSGGSANTGSYTQKAAFWDDDEDEDDDHNDGGEGEDELYEEAVELVRRLGKASVSLLQRRLRIGYTRAARLIDVMEDRGIVGPATEGSKPREVLK